jgi:hypothetical protein
MATARKSLLDMTRPGWVHAISRCVRRAFLCGGTYEHRRDWVESRMRELAGVFAVEVASYAVMSNHLHVVLRMDPEAVQSWPAQVVAERWCAVFHKCLPKDAAGRVPAAVVAQFVQDGAWVAERRKRLGSLSWFMRALSEEIARQANREDGCTGRFWEGRFVSVPLLDQAALVACMAYVDLNPVRSRMTDRPERSTHTGARERIRGCQRLRLVERARARGLDERTVLAKAGLAAAPRHAEEGVWVARMARCVVETAEPAEAGGPGRLKPALHTSQPLPALQVDDYLTLLDATGRALKAGKRGAIPPELAPILARLDLRVEDWLTTMRGWRGMLGAAIGAAASRATEATRRGLQWMQNRCPLFTARPEAA